MLRAALTGGESVKSLMAMRDWGEMAGEVWRGAEKLREGSLVWSRPGERFRHLGRMEVVVGREERVGGSSWSVSSMSRFPETEEKDQGESVVTAAVSLAAKEKRLS